MVRGRGMIVLAGLVLLATQVSGTQPGAGDSQYRVPPPEIVRILEAPPPPTVVVSPARDRVAIIERASMPPIAELAQPMLRLAGLRINPLNNGPHRTPAVTSVTFKPIAGGPAHRIADPEAASLAPVGFSPDGAHFAFVVIGRDALTLRLADPVTGHVRDVGPLRLNGTFGPSPCSWTFDSRALHCHAVPANRGAAPPAPQVPSGPEIQETSGRPAPVRTYQDLLTSAHDELLFEHYATSQIVRVDVATRRVTPLGPPALYTRSDASPDGRYLLVERLVRPFSRLVPYNDFPKQVEVWTAEGTVVRRIADVPLGETVPVNGVITGPRAVEWHAAAPATLFWAEALDQGDPRVQVPHRDRVLTLSAPFSDAPREVTRTEWRFRSLDVTERGVLLVAEFDRPTRRVRTWLMEPGTSPRVLNERNAQDRYADPGMPVRRAGTGAILQAGSAIYLNGAGASPEGDRPFLDRFDLATGRTERLFHCDPAAYETVLAVLDDEAGRLVTRRETRRDPPNVFVVDRRSGSRTPLTDYVDPAPELSQASKQLLTYERADGVKLTATLYLPAGYTKGQRLPMLVWAYPREFTDAAVAGQVSGSPHRFTLVSGASHLLLLTQGYAILDDPSLPIVGPGETANDTYIEQLVAGAKAAVDTVVAMGVADPDRIGVGGHSYGAFMTANLLAHSDLFRAGIARSGAYNRTLTPFGFQAETRTFWEVPDLYARMSPFWYAHKVNEPILLIHGAADNNSGTFPIQSERFYMALKGHGATARYVVLPHESHGYVARESVLHTVAEMLDWMDRHVKHAAPRTSTAAPSQPQF